MSRCRARNPFCFALLVALAGCGGGGGSRAIPAGGATPDAPPPVPAPAPAPVGGSVGTTIETTPPFEVTPMQRFDEPWAIAALPDGRLLVTERPGALKLVEPGVRVTDVAGVPQVDYGGQGGLGDVVLHPGFAANRWIYLSYAERDDAGRSGAAVARATLELDRDGAPALSDLQVLWRQLPKVSGQSHYGHRLAFDAFGKLWVSSGERMRGDPAQDPGSALGKLLRLNDDGSVPPDNPFASRGGVAAQVWTLGHRNPLGLAFDERGQAWVAEMGPRGGDELNRIQREANYGWPRVSEGDGYDGTPIPRHATQPQFVAPVLSWTPVISPASLIFYNGSALPGWRGNALLAGLTAQALVRVAFEGERAREVGRYPMGARIREIEQASDGALWLLEDGPGGRLLRLRAR